MVLDYMKGMIWSRYCALPNQQSLLQYPRSTHSHSFGVHYFTYLIQTLKQNLVQLWCELHTQLHIKRGQNVEQTLTKQTGWQFDWEKI